MRHQQYWQLDGLACRHVAGHHHWQQQTALRRLSARCLNHDGVARQAIRSQRWRALKRGLDLQITKTLPRRRTTLQSR